MKCVILVIVISVINVGHCQTDCPNQVECLTNPCEDAICPRFLNAQCIPDNCNGVCRAAFYHIGREDPEITNCPTKTCSERECPKNRVCVEEVFPPSCPENEPVCRQYMQAVCELPPKPRPPSDCSVVQCGPKMECILDETDKGPVARCVETRPTTCEELPPCDRGMECRFRPRGDLLHPIVRCVPVRTKPRHPRDCSELVCNDGFSCALFGAEGRQRARCIRERPRPQSCQDLMCEDVGMLCSEERGSPRCRLPLNCNEVTCPSSHECAVVAISDIPLSFRCPFNEKLCKLMIVNKLEDDKILTCLDRTLTLSSCSEFECSDDRVCAEKVIPNDDESTISACIPKDQISTVGPIATCDSVPDDFCSENQACVDFQQGDYRGFAHCSQINCQVSGCIDEEDTCVASSPQFLSQTGISHSCAPVERVKVENNTCSGGRTPCQGSTNCTDVRIANAQSGSVCIGPFQLPPRSCELLSCKEDEECALDVLNGQVIQASCEPSTFIETLLGALSALNL